MSHRTARSLGNGTLHFLRASLDHPSADESVLSALEIVFCEYQKGLVLWLWIISFESIRGVVGVDEGEERNAMEN